ncbi:MAG: TRAP transporter substrate-binding protein [Planctomycetaceae bacterium]|nr:TRAP transporter substrate-binding protein [Planctomycetaceae bacterium]
MHESTLKKLRFLPVVAAVLVAVVIWWNLRAASNQVRLVFSTGSEVGLYHRLASQMRDVIEANHPDILVQLIQSAGSNENITRIDRGQAQLALVQNDARGGNSVHSLASLYPEVLHLLCRADANVASLSDLSGRRIGVGAVGSGTEQVATNLLQFAGVTLEKGQVRHGAFGEAVNQLKAKKIDAAFVLTGLGAEIIRHALADGQLELAPIQIQPDDSTDPEVISRTLTAGFQVHYPYASSHTIPLMAYNGRPVSPVPSLSVQAVLVCQEDVDAEIIERITRTLFKQRAVLSQKETAFTHLDEQGAQLGLQFPLHQGAENFYRRKEPGFLNQHAETMGFVLTLALLSWSVIVWFQRWYLQRRKNRVDTYYKAIDEVIIRLPDITRFEELVELESELTRIDRRASDELIQEKLAADESYVIYQNMLNGCRSMLQQARDRLPDSPETTPDRQPAG